MTKVESVLPRFQQHNVRLTINLKKCVWFTDTIEFLGNVISAEGRRPSPRLIFAIVNAPAPQNAKEVRSYLGLLNFYSAYIPHFSILVKPMRILTENNVPFQWTNAAQTAFESSKSALVSSPVLIHFDPSKELILCSDASPVGAGVVLASRIKEKGRYVEKTIAFALATFNHTQRSYSQLDREGLALVFGVQHFHKYLWGRRFQVVTDNSPLKCILSPQKGSPQLATHRRQHWASMLEAYNFSLVHRRSALLLHVDALSRLPDPSVTVPASLVNFVNDSPSDLPNLPVTAKVTI